MSFEWGLSNANLLLCDRFEEMSREANPVNGDGSRKNSYNRLFPFVPVSCADSFKLHDYEKELLPNPSTTDSKIYQDYLQRGLTMTCTQSKDDLEMYLSYYKISKGI